MNNIKDNNMKMLFVNLMILFTLVSCSSNFDTNKSVYENVNKDKFYKPDKNNYPETWFHLIGGNVSKEGITADLEAISASGISGIQLFHGQFGGAWPGVSPQIEALSESWDELIVWTAEECKRLDLKFTMQNCPGWSYAGGPWIEPENSMRHLVQSRADIIGGKEVKINLDMPQPSEEEWRNYKDLFVIAFPTPEGDTGERLIPKNISSNKSDLPWYKCIVGQERLTLSPSNNNPTVIDLKFGEPVTLRTVEFPAINSFSHAWSYSPDVTVDVYSEINGDFLQVAHLDMPQASWQDDQPISIACDESTSSEFRIEITNQHDMTLSYINLYSAARQQNWESEAAWTLRRIVREEYPQQSKDSWVSSSKIKNISTSMTSEGELTWDAPEGNWTILRIGHVNTGMKNGPAPLEATGWESNKLDPAGARANFDGYIGRLLKDNSRLRDSLLDGILIDSWECKTQTWTNGLDDTFLEKWDYSLFSMFPAIFGYIVEDPEVTARFLRDWRVTLNDLLVQNFFGEMGSIAKENGLNISYETASGDIFPGDILEYYKYADVPMSEFWHPRQDSYVGSIDFKPVKPSVSAGRVYGKNRVGAEAFTSFNLTWNEHPRFLKDIADEHLARGITHLVFHTYTHNPRTDFLPPSTSFGSNIGTPFLRLQTWWQHMPYFTDYLARCNYMLELGNPVSDVLMYIGDEQNHKPPQSLEFPEGYSYDYCNPDVLLNRLTVKDGCLETPEGISYKLLWLYDCKRMLPETLEKILYFIEQGVTVVGVPPTGIATLRGGEKEMKRFKKVVDDIWGTMKETKRSIGKGMLYTTDLTSALTSEKINTDINVSFSDLRWLHRKTKDSDMYFLSTSVDKGYKGELSFRSKGNVELWDPITGKTSMMQAKNITEEHTVVEMDIPAGTSSFIVFNKDGKNMNSDVSYVENKVYLEKEWSIYFPNGWGVEPSTIQESELVSWKDLTKLNEEGKSFSGTAVYKTSFNVDEIKKDINYQLDLGRVEMIAKVKVNGIEVDTRWTYPYTVDITESLKLGDNELEVDVTSTWFNRLTYDAGLPESERKTWTINGPKANLELKEYGLIGPVSISKIHK